MDRTADVIKRSSDENSGEVLFALACIGSLIERAELETWLGIKAEAHLVMQTVDDLFSRDEVAQMKMLADLSDALAMTGQMRRSG